MKNKFCSNCGQQLEAGAKFCPQCGATQNVAPSNQGQPVNQQPQTPPVQPNPQSYQQAPQQPNMQQGYQQQVPPTGQQPYQQQVPPTGQYQQRVNQFTNDIKKFKNVVPGQMGSQPNLGFWDSVKYVTANTFDFKTPEIRKAVYWWGTLGQCIVGLALYMIMYFFAITGFSSGSELMLLLGNLFYIIFYVFCCASGISLLAAAVRRTRYIANNPWLVLVPFYNIYLLLVDHPQYQSQPYQQPNQMQQPYQQQNYGQQPQYMNQQQAPQQPVQNQHQPQQVPSQKPNDDQNTPQN